MGTLISKISSNRMLVLRMVLLGLFLALLAGFVSDQYNFVQGLVRFICLSCLGITD